MPCFISLVVRVRFCLVLRATVLFHILLTFSGVCTLGVCWCGVKDKDRTKQNRAGNVTTTGLFSNLYYYHALLFSSLPDGVTRAAGRRRRKRYQTCPFCCTARPTADMAGVRLGGQATVQTS